jgi:hypothetical protein
VLVSGCIRGRNLLLGEGGEVQGLERLDRTPERIGLSIWLDGNL